MLNFRTDTSFKSGSENGVFFGEYKKEINYYRGKNYASKVFMFPGQGSSYGGMFSHEYNSNMVFKKRFSEADRFCENMDLQPASMFVVSPSDLQKNDLKILRNLCLLTIEVSLAESLMAKRVFPDAVMGHSFGEYAALVASGLVKFEDMLDVVYHREFFTPEEFSLGGLVAVNREVDLVDRVLEGEDYFWANFNSKGQSVLAVKPGETSKELVKKLKAAKIPAKLLTEVPHPYHSPLMSEVAAQMKVYLANKEWEFGKLKVPMFSSVLGRWISDDEKREDVLRIMSDQVISPVDFVNQVEQCSKLGLHGFWEVGPQKVHTQFVKNILPDGEFLIQDCESYFEDPNKISLSDTELKSLERGEVFVALSDIISRVTGYSVSEISIVNKFQEDLGIDSIKKAEIVFTLFKEAKIHPGNDFNLSKINNLADAVEYAKSREGKTDGFDLAENLREGNFSRYSSVWVEREFERGLDIVSGKGQYLVVSLTDSYDSLFAQIGGVAKLLKKQSSGEKFYLILDGRGFGDQFSSYSQWKDELALPVISYLQEAFKEFRSKKSLLYLALVSGLGERRFLDGLDVLLASFKKERQDFFYKSILMDEVGDVPLNKLVEKEFKDPINVEIKYSEGKRWIRDLRSVPESPNREMYQSGVVVVIGGAKGVTYQMVSQLMNFSRAQVVILGRSHPTDESVEGNLRQLYERSPDISYMTCDASDRRYLDRVLTKVEDQFGKIDLIINGAGFEESKLFLEKTKEGICKELDAKVGVTWNLVDLSKKYLPRKIIVFSSVVERFGNDGQTTYSFANRVASDLVLGLNQNNDLGIQGVVIHWPAWMDSGMTENLGVQHRLAQSGVGLIRSERAFELLWEDIVQIREKENRSCYYLDEADILTYKMPLADFSALYPLLGVVKQASPLSFSRNFDCEHDLFLRDHKINDYFVVPASFAVSEFLALSCLKFGRFGVLKDFVVDNMLMVGSMGKEGFVGLTESDDGVLTYLRTEIPNFRSYIKDEASDETLWDWHKQFKPYQEIKGDSVYRQGVINLGKSYKNIDKSYMSEDGLLKAIMPSRNRDMLPVSSVFSSLVTWVDSCFQALCINGLYRNNGLGVPVSIKELFFNPQIDVSQNLTLYSRVDRVSLEEIVGDVVMLNSKGEVMLGLLGLQMVNINEPHLIKDPLLEIIDLESKIGE